MIVRWLGAADPPEIAGGISPFVPSRPWPNEQKRLTPESMPDGKSNDSAKWTAHWSELVTAQDEAPQQVAKSPRRSSTTAIVLGVGLVGALLWSVFGGAQ